MRERIKIFIVLVMHLVTWPFGLLSMLDYKLLGSERVYLFSAMLLSLIPGKIGQYIRTSFYKQTLTKSSYDTMVGFCSWFSHPTAELGKRVALGSFTIVGTVTIGDNVMVSSKSSVLSGKFQHGDGLGMVKSDTTEPSYQRVYIGSNTWIGEGAIVMANVDEDCIVSAGSVVTKPMKCGLIAIGNPARFIKKGYGENV